ncbi:class I SAM-dependent methyltransferase [Kibdelosporangium lantanae]
MTPFRTLNEAAGQVAAFTTAVRLGLLDRIDREPATPAELARTCGATERGVRVVLTVLESSGFVERLADGRYQPVLTGLAALHPLLPLWEHLPEAVRTGDPVYEVTSPLADVASLPPSVLFLTEAWGDVTDRVAAVLPEAKHVLDVGAGPAPWSVAYCGRNPDCRVTAVDMPSALPATRRAVSRAGLTDRYEFASGDVAGGAYDLVIMAQVCHLFDTATCTAMIHKLTPVLAGGGVLAIVDTLPGSSGAAIQELSLYLRSRHGSMRQPETYREWLAEAGLGDVTSTDLRGELSVTVVTGRKLGG